MNRSDEHQSSNGYAPDQVPRVHLYEYLTVFVRYRRLFVSVIVIGTALVAGYLMIAPQTYSASASLLPPDKSEGVSLAALVQSSSKLDFKALTENASAETFVRLLQSRTLADSLVRRFNLLEYYEIAPADRDLAIDQVLGDLSVSADRQGFVEIAFNARTGYMASDEEQRKNAKLSADIVNAAIEILDKLNQKKAVTRARRSREFIGRMRTIKRAELDSAQAMLLRFQQRNKAIALDKQIEASVDGLVEIQTQMQKTEVLLAAARQELDEGTPQVQSLIKQLQELRSQKARLEGGRAGGEALAIPLRGVPDLMRQLANLKLNLEVSTQIYTYLEAQYNQEQIQEARELPTVSVMDFASAPTRRSSPRRALMLGISAVGFVVLSTLLIFVLDFYRRSMAGVDASQRKEMRRLMGAGKGGEETTTEAR